jgi:hypothetical protein
MTINYIHNMQGQIEYAILPLELWTAIQTYLPTDLASPLKKTVTKPIFEERPPKSRRDGIGSIRRVPKGSSLRDFGAVPHSDYQKASLRD